MRLTKDESRILGVLMEEHKFDLLKLSRDENKDLIDKLDELQERLWKYGKDMRRQGRTSINGFNDCLKRYKTTTKITKDTNSET